MFTLPSPPSREGYNPYTPLKRGFSIVSEELVVIQGFKKVMVETAVGV